MNCISCQLSNCPELPQQLWSWQKILHNSFHPRPHLHALMYDTRSARSAGFFRPANTILVPGIYFFGFTRNSYMCLSDHVIPLDLTASEYPKPAVRPALLPKSAQSGGPDLRFPPSSIEWHCAHFALKSFAPFLTSPTGTSTSGSGLPIAISPFGRCGCGSKCGGLLAKSETGGWS